MEPKASGPFPAIDKDHPLILASSSPRRKRLLEQIALPFRPSPVDIDENGASGAPERIALALAEKKAGAASSPAKGRWVLGADTLVVLDDKVMGKPDGADEAREMLSLLNEKSHHVVTGFCLLDPSGQRAHAEAVTTAVTMKRLTREEIEGYVMTGEPFGKAGSYAIQGIGAFMVESISGSYTNVVGLPVCALIRALLSVGALKRFPLIQK
jgi:septum formation protein